MRPLFSDAPMMQSAQMMPVQPAHSSLASALSGIHPFSLPSAQVPSVPLSSLMASMGQGRTATPSDVSSSTPDLSWNPNNPVGTESLGGATANQGGMLANALATYAPGAPTQGAMPGMPSTVGAIPGMPTPGAAGPGMPPQAGGMAGVAQYIRSMFGGGGGQ